MFLRIFSSFSRFRYGDDRCNQSTQAWPPATPAPPGGAVYCYSNISAIKNVDIRLFFLCFFIIDEFTRGGAFGVYIVGFRDGGVSYSMLLAMKKVDISVVDISLSSMVFNMPKFGRS